MCNDITLKALDYASHELEYFKKLVSHFTYKYDFIVYTGVPWFLCTVNLFAVIFIQMKFVNMVCVY